MTEKLGTLLERLSPIARDEIVRVLGQSNVCIATCRVLQAVLLRFGFESFPVATEAIACNRIQAEIFEGLGGREKAANATPDQNKDWRERGGWAVAISPEVEALNVPTKGEGWNGHLILRVEDILLDGSIEQCNNPKKDLILPKLLSSRAVVEWDEGKAYKLVKLPNGCEVIYRKLEDDFWRDTPHWKGETEPYKTKIRSLVDTIASAVNTTGT